MECYIICEQQNQTTRWKNAFPKFEGFSFARGGLVDFSNFPYIICKFGWVDEVRVKKIVEKCMGN